MDDIYKTNVKMLHARRAPRASALSWVLTPESCPEFVFTPQRGGPRRPRHAVDILQHAYYYMYMYMQHATCICTPATNTCASTICTLVLPRHVCFASAPSPHLANTMLTFQNINTHISKSSYSHRTHISKSATHTTFQNLHTHTRPDDTHIEKRHAHSLSAFHTHTLAHTARSHTHATPVRTHTSSLSAPVRRSKSVKSHVHSPASHRPVLRSSSLPVVATTNIL